MKGEGKEKNIGKVRAFRENARKEGEMARGKAVNVRLHNVSRKGSAAAVVREHYLVE